MGIERADDPHFDRKCARQECGHALNRHAFRAHAEHDVHHCLDCECPAFVEPERPSQAS
jgi:hypothetical protein